MNETEQRDNTHGEAEKKARFGPSSPDFTPSGDSSDPRGPDNIAAGKSSDPRGEDSLQSREAAGGVGSRGAVGGAESGLANQLGKGFTGVAGAAAGGGALGSLRPFLKFLTRNKRKTAAGGFIGAVVGIMIFLAGIASGPFEFVHFAQLLQQFHLRSNEDFGNERGARTLLYALTGQAQKSRLGFVGNYAADKWEAKLLKETGLRPVYSAKTRIVVGFEIVNDKYINGLLDADEKTSARLESAMGKGAKVTTAGSVKGQDVVRGNGEVLPGNTHIMSVKDMGWKERSKFIRTIGKLTGTNNITSTLASRLLKKRGGVIFHPFRYLTHKAVDKLVDWRYERRKEAARQDKEGTKNGGVKPKDTKDTNDDKKPDAPDEADKVAAEGAEETIDEAAKELAKNNIKILAKRIGTGSIAVGILCAAKGFGDAVPDYKYTNNVLPMMRMGFRVVSMGNEVMSGQGLTLDEVGAFKDALYDNQTGTNWTEAGTIQGELGHKQTGYKMPPEASLQNVNDKPLFFDILDQVPFLDTACDISGIAGSIPIVKDVLNVGSDAVLAGLNVAAGAAGTSVDAIMEGALALVSGNSVDTLASGADYGNLANTGAFLAANDNAVSMGGSPLSNQQRAELRLYEQNNLRNENQTKSFAERYLDPYSSNSLSGQLIDNAPHSLSSFADIFNSSLGLLTGRFASILPLGNNSLVSAAGNVDYGVPKFGFSLADQENPKFENPYNNAEKVEPRLNELNDEYGKPCFGMSVHTASDGISIETEAMGSDDLNVFNVLDNEKCDPQKNHDPWFKRYRFYLADAVSTVSNACFQADGDPKGEKYCEMLGFDTEAALSSSSSTGSVINGDAQQLAQQLLDNPNVTYPYADEVDGTTVEDVLKSVVRTGEGIVNSPDVSFKSVPVSTDLLQALVEYAENYPIGLNALTNADHSSTSNHYKGIAIDIACSPALNVAAFNKIATKYGGHNNGEVCPGNKHYHYDF